MAYSINNISGFGTTTAPNYSTTAKTTSSYSPYTSTYSPSAVTTPVSGLAAQTTQDITNQLSGYLSPGTISMYQQQAAERGGGSGFGVDSAATNAALERMLGLTAEGQVQQGISNSFSQQGIDNSSSEYAQTLQNNQEQFAANLQNNKEQFAANLGLDYSKLNEQQQEFVQKMFLDTVSMQQSNRGGGQGGSQSGGQGGNRITTPTTDTGTTTTAQRLGPAATTQTTQADPTLDYWSNPDNYDPSLGMSWTDAALSDQANSSPLYDAGAGFGDSFEGYT